MIYFVRHGETDFNLYNISQGQLDTSLNKTGLIQAEIVAQKLKDYNFDYIFCSTSIRASQTAEFINKFHNKEIMYDARLKEVSKGSLEGNRNPQELYDKFFKNPHAYGGETEEDVYNRVHSFLKDISKYKGKNILVVGHGGIHKYLVFCLKNKDIKKDKLEITNIKNCEVVEFEF